MLAISTFVLPLALAWSATAAPAQAAEPQALAPAAMARVGEDAQGGAVRLAAKGKAKGNAAAAKQDATDDSKAEDSKANAEEAPPVEAPADAAETAAEREVKYGGAEVGTAIGGATGFVFKRGFYAQGDLGGFIRFGGWNDGGELCRRCKEVATSLLQPYIGLSVGYDFFDFLGGYVNLAQGFVASAAPFGSKGGGSTDSPRDYGITYVNVGGTLSWYFFDRLAASFKVFGGGSFLSPAPDVRNGVPVPFAGADIGTGVGLRYATLLTDVIIGLDVNAMVSGSPDGAGGVLFIPAMSFAPVIKYVF